LLVTPYFMLVPIQCPKSHSSELLPKKSL
jgi:hypothetical protein